MQVYNFSVIRGDTYDGAKFSISVNGTPLVITGADILCEFKPTINSPAVLTWKVGTGITITSATEFWFDSQIVDVAGGEYIFDVQITLLSGRRKTYVKGKMTVADDISRPVA